MAMHCGSSRATAGYWGVGVDVGVSVGAGVGVGVDHNCMFLLPVLFG